MRAPLDEGRKGMTRGKTVLWSSLRLGPTRSRRRHKDSQVSYQGGDGRKPPHVGKGHGAAATGDSEAAPNTEYLGTSLVLQWRRLPEQAAQVR